MQYEDAIRRLGLFGEVVTRLAESPPASAANFYDGGPLVRAVRSIYIGGSDRISMSDLSELYGSIPIDRSVIQSYEELRERLSAYLDGFTRVSSPEKESLTRREVLNLFLGDRPFGTINLTSDPKAQENFTRIMRHIIQIFESMVSVNTRAVEQVRSRQKIVTD